MSVSVVIPVLNEAAGIARTLRALRPQNPREIIVVDGGSSDGTLDHCIDADLVLSCAPGRARQMNFGASRAAGDVVLFLHGDCTLETGALAAAEKILKSSKVVGGCFTMRVEHDGWLYRAIDRCATARVRLTGIAYGDQGLFLRRADFRGLGGFPSLRFMEDVFFSCRLRRHGRIRVAPQCIFVSGRRWQQAGLVRQTLRNWALTALACSGVHPDSLAHFYP